MNRTISIAIVSVMAVLTAACASMPSDPESDAKLAANLGPVEPIEPGDYQLSCDGLAAQIRNTQWAISALNLQISQADNTATAFSVLGALAAVSGAYAPNIVQARNASAEQTIASAGNALSTGAGMSKQAVLGTYQARYGTLVSTFNGKNCPST